MNSSEFKLLSIPLFQITSYQGYYTCISSLNTCEVLRKTRPYSLLLFGILQSTYSMNLKIRADSPALENSGCRGKTI